MLSWINDLPPWTHQHQFCRRSSPPPTPLIGFQPNNPCLKRDLKGRLLRRLSHRVRITRHSPVHVGAGLGPRGIYIGEEVSAGGSAWCYDPFQLYTDGVITSPNILVLGTIGSGKSAAVKTLLYRSIGLLGSPGGQPRWCAILDPKGEYGPLADALGLARLNLHPGGTTRLNPLDAGPLHQLHRRPSGSPNADGRRARRCRAEPGAATT